MISDKKLNAISIALGLLLTAYVAQDLHFNPRWYGDNGPGRRQAAAGYCLPATWTVAYGTGQGGRSGQTVLHQENDRRDAASALPQRLGTAHVDTVRQVVAEGLNVVVHHCVEANGACRRTKSSICSAPGNGRIVWRKTLRKRWTGSRAAAAAWANPSTSA